MKGSLDVRVKVEARLNPSEDPEKVIRSVANVIRGKPHVVGGDVKLEAEGPEALSEVYLQVRSRRVMAALRRVLLENRDGAGTWFYLNRQAAYVGRVVLAETEQESPLGPIKVTLESEDLDGVIEWLVPREESLRR